MQSEQTFVPLNAEGVPVSLDVVSLGDTNSESYGSCKCNNQICCGTYAVVLLCFMLPYLCYLYG